MTNREQALEWFRKRIENIPMTGAKQMYAEAVKALEQPEIIRCKDCKYYGRADKRRFYRGMDCLNKHIDTIVPDRDFCSRAKRRKESNE